MEEKLYREGDKFKIKIPSISNHFYNCTLTQVKANEFMLISSDGNRYNDQSIVGNLSCHGITLDQVMKIVTSSNDDAKIIEINGKKVEEIFSFQIGDVVKISYGVSFDKVIIFYDENCYRLVVLESITLSDTKRGSAMMICGTKEWKDLRVLNEKLYYISEKLKVCEIRKCLI